MVPGCRLGRGATSTHHRNGGGGGRSPPKPLQGSALEEGVGVGTGRPAGQNLQGGGFSAPLPHPAQRARTGGHTKGPCTFPLPPDLPGPRPRAWWPGRQGVRPALALEGNRALRAGVPTCAQDSRCGRCAARCAVSAAGEGVGDLSPGLPQRLFAAQPCGPSCLSSLTVSLPPSPQVLPPSLCPPEPELSSPPLSRRPAQRSAPPPARPSPPGPSRGLRAPGLVSELPRPGGGGDGGVPPRPRARDPLPSSAPAAATRIHQAVKGVGTTRSARALPASPLAARHSPPPEGCLVSWGEGGLVKRGGVSKREKAKKLACQLPRDTSCCLCLVSVTLNT